ncbi:MAG: M1 family aminopeptidase [Acidobacteriota bacterium]
MRPRLVLSRLLPAVLLAGTALGQGFNFETFNGHDQLASAAQLLELQELGFQARWQLDSPLKVENLVIERDKTQLVLNGLVVLSDPVGGRTLSMTFLGDGRLRVDPPIQQEKLQVARFFGEEKVDVAFDTAELFFVDTELEAKLRNPDAHAELSKATRADLDAQAAKSKLAGEWLREEEKLDLAKLEHEEAQRRRGNALSGAIELYQSALHADYRTGLSALMEVDETEVGLPNGARVDGMFLRYDPRGEEVTSLHARFDHGSRKPWSTITQFAESSDYRGRYKWAATSPRLEKRKRVDAGAHSHRIVMQLDPKGTPNMKMQIESEIEVVRRPLKILHLRVTRLLEATSCQVEGRDNEYVQPTLPGAQKRHSPDIYVMLPREYLPGERFKIALELEGNVIYPNGFGNYSVREEDNWFPTPSTALGGISARFDTTLVIPERFTAVSNGADTPCRDEDRVDGWECFRFVTKRGIDFATFNLGKDARIDTATAQDGTPIAVYSNTQASVSFLNSSRRGVVEANLSKQGDVLANKAIHAHAVYSDWFGPFPYSRLALTPHPKGHGRGSASLLLLTQMAFLTTADRAGMGMDVQPWYWDQFVSHEIAHQWWGGAAGIRSGRDQWFSEGFADYAAALYLESIDRHRDTEWFHSMLKDWHRDLKKDDGHINDIAPLSLGNRFVSAENRSGYEGRRQDFMYKKGCFVLHMLRIYARHLTGSKEDGDALFKKAVRKFIDEHYTGHPSNLDMLKSFSESYGKSMDWFFKQWVHGMGMPTIEFSYEWDSHPEGGHLLRGRVVQKNTGFKFPVAVYLSGGKGKKGWTDHFYQWIDKPDHTFEVGPIQKKANKVTLNDDYGLLAIVEDVPWQNASGF